MSYPFKQHTSVSQESLNKMNINPSPHQKLGDTKMRHKERRLKVEQNIGWSKFKRQEDRFLDKTPSEEKMK
jgi:hypothetical protein